MYKLLIIGFIIRLYGRFNVFNSGNISENNNDDNYSDTHRHTKVQNYADLRNYKNKSNLNNDNGNRVDNSKNNNNNNVKNVNLFILGDNIVKNVNGFLITEAINHKHIVKVHHLVQRKCNACTTMRSHEKYKICEPGKDHYS